MATYFSKNLKYIREKIGLTKNELAKKMHVSQSTVSRWESGEMGITVEKAYELSLILDVPLPELVGKDIETLSNDISKEYVYTKTISDEDGYTVEIKTTLPFEKLPKDEQQELIDSAMEDLLKAKKEIRQKGE